MEKNNRKGKVLQIYLHKGLYKQFLERAESENLAPSTLGRLLLIKYLKEGNV